MTTISFEHVYKERMRDNTTNTKLQSKRLKLRNSVYSKLSTRYHDEESNDNQMVRHFYSNMRYIIPTLLAKLNAIPAVSLVIILMMDFAPLERFVIFTVFATPAAASGSMTASLGGDADLAGELIVTSTTASVITIFLRIFLLKSTGLI